MEESKIIIAICDDEEYVHSEVQQYLTEYMKLHGCEFEIVDFYDGTELLNSVQNIDILYLDIEMSHLNGIEAAKSYNRINSDCKVIVLTSWVERFKEAFVIGAFRFVTKRIQKQELWDSGAEALSSIAGGTYMDVWRDGEKYQIRQKDILYLMADRSCSKIFTRKLEYRSEEPLSWWQKQLDERMFFQCHRSYIVNLGEITSIEKNCLVLSTGEKVEISRRKYTDFMQAYMLYDTRIR